MIEVLVAVVILAIAALAAVQVQRASTMANQAALNREVAGALARQLLERLERIPYPIETGAFVGCLDDTAGAFVDPCPALSASNPLGPDGENDPSGGFFARRWQVTQNAFADANDERRATVRVRVSWNQAGRAENVEIGSIKGWTR